MPFNLYAPQRALPFPRWTMQRLPTDWPKARRIQPATFRWPPMSLERLATHVYIVRGHCFCTLCKHIWLEELGILKWNWKCIILFSAIWLIGESIILISILKISQFSKIQSWLSLDYSNSIYVLISSAITNQMHRWSSLFLSQSISF